MGKKNKKKKEEVEFGLEIPTLLDPDDILDPEEQKKRSAQAVYDMIVRGASVDDLLESFNYDHFKSALSYYNIRGRSSLTYMKDMAIELVKVLGDGMSKQRAGTKQDTQYLMLEKQVDSLKEELFQEKQTTNKLEKELDEARKKIKKLKKKLKSLELKTFSM